MGVVSFDHTEVRPEGLGSPHCPGCAVQVVVGEFSVLHHIVSGSVITGVELGVADH